MRVTSKIVITLLLAAGTSSALAATVCVKNKDGVAENWQTNERNAGLWRLSNACSDLPASPRPSAQFPAAHAGVPAYQPASVITASSGRATGVQLWITSPADNNMRQLIQRWSATVGWSLVWGVDKDIPLDSSDQVTGDFKTAVRRLLASTSLSDITLKPCFYTNSVVRVVRETAKCNPNE